MFVLKERKEKDEERKKEALPVKVISTLATQPVRASSAAN